MPEELKMQTIASPFRKKTNRKAGFYRAAL
jgi:hypothetical protein